MARPPRSLLPREDWPASVSRPLVSPLQPSVVYTVESPDALDAQYEGRTQGFTYAREGHPNAEVLAAMIGRMEGAETSVVTGSGMAAVGAAILGVVRAGDHVIGGTELYGRSLRLLSDELPRLGVETSLVDTTDAGAVAAAMRPETRLILVETVSNPTLRVADIAGISRLPGAGNRVLAVDNTFATPRALRPLSVGADIVIHSVTKLLAGHSDATLGWVGTTDADLGAAIAGQVATWGLTASPFDCWLAERGLLSFDLRYERAAANAARLADALAAMPGVDRVLYPGRPDHPDHNRALGLLGGQGGNMVTFSIAGGRAAANRLVRAADGLAFAPTLGDIATVISHPASSSHRSLGADARTAMGISEGTFRVSVGVEPAGELVALFAAALQAASD